jgi:glycosyltransferase involved in cell wall biosynthesis
MNAALTSISVVVPTYNRPALLRQALASIRKLERECFAFEILVGDNGSDPDTPGVAAEFDARRLPVSTPGPSAARNVCLRAATNELIAFLDDDDVWLEGHLRPHLDKLSARPDLKAVFSQRVWGDVDLRPAATVDPASDPGEGDVLLRNMLGGVMPQLGTMLVRKSALNEIGLLDEGLIGGEDWDWVLRFAARGELGYVEHLSNIVRGRPPGSYNRLQFERVRYDRKVFARHATRNWRALRSPLGLARAYRGSFMHYFRYFENAAMVLADSGDRAGTLSAISGAFQIFPLRSLHNSLANRPLRQSLLKILLGPAGLKNSTQPARD